MSLHELGYDDVGINWGNIAKGAAGALLSSGSKKSDDSKKKEDEAKQAAERAAKKEAESKAALKRMVLYIVGGLAALGVGGAVIYRMVRK